MLLSQAESLRQVTRKTGRAGENRGLRQFRGGIGDSKEVVLRFRVADHDLDVRSGAGTSATPLIFSLRQTSLCSSGTPRRNIRPPRVVRPVAGNAGATMANGSSDALSSLLPAPASSPALERRAAAISAAKLPRSVES